MEDKSNISKVTVLFKSIMDSKASYLRICDKNGGEVMVMKLLLDAEDVVSFIDPFIDNGFKIEKIEKDYFDNHNSKDVMEFNIK